MEFNKLDPYSPRLSERIFAFEKIWETREQFLPDAYTRIFDEEDYWDPFLHREFAGQHGWTRLGSA
jgi:hypothetical protein